MATDSAVVGLNIVCTRQNIGMPIDLDSALSRPCLAGPDHLYGLYGPNSLRSFVHKLASKEWGRLHRSYELSQIHFEVSHTRTFDPLLGLADCEYLSWHPRADLRSAFQLLFCDVVERQHGDSEDLRRARVKLTESAFHQALLTFPDCITEALSETNIVVAVIPMKVAFDLVLPVSIVAKKAVGRLLRSIKTDVSQSRKLQITHTDGRCETLDPPLLERPVITYSGRPGNVWRRGTHHPDSVAEVLP